MSDAIPLSRTTPSPARKPLHGRLHTLRRQVVSAMVGRFMRPPGNLVTPGSLPRTGIQRILVCRPNHRLGNTVLMTPLMSEIERHFPGAEVDVLSSGQAARSIYGGFSILGDLFLIDRRAFRHPWATISTLMKLRAKRYDLVVDAAQGSSSGRIAASMARARHQLRVDDFTDGMPVHFAARAVHALRRARGEHQACALPTPDLRLTDAERQAGTQALLRVMPSHGDSEVPVLAIFPNATGSKRLDGAWWKTFLDALSERTGPWRIVELVAADGLSRVDDAYPTFFTSDPRKLAAFIDAAGTYISADCGVMHLAAATRATTIGLFGTTDPLRYAPYGGHNLGFTCEDGCPRQAAMRVAAHMAVYRTASAPDTAKRL